jgi:Holliday junction resolvase
VNPFLRKKQGNSGGRAETKHAKKIGARTTPVSGALRGAKGDMILNADVLPVMIEAKSTQADQLPLKYGWLRKVAEEARLQNKTPALSVLFTHNSGEAKEFGEWTMVPTSVFQRLIKNAVSED